MGINFNIKNTAVFISIICAIGIALFPFSSQPVFFSYSAAVILITLTFWSTAIIPPFLAGLIFFALVAVFKLAGPSELFSGFASTAVWLIISGFVIGSAISFSELDKKLASIIAPHLTVSYAKLIFGLVMSAVILGFIMPSSVGRAVVLIPVGMALAEKVGFTQGSNGRKGVATALAIACNMPSFAVLPANIPNMILAGASENLFSVHFGYMEYLLLHFPVLGVIKSLLLVMLVLIIFPDKVSNNMRQNVEEEGNELNRSDILKNNRLQKKVAILLGITLLFWMTDSIHGVNSAWVGLVTAILLLLPKWGVVPPKSFNNSVDFGTVVFVSAALGLGALVNVSGVGEFMGQTFSALLPDSTAPSFFSFMSLSFISTFTGLIATIPGVPTVLTPMATDFAQQTGFSLPAVLMTQVIGFSTILFPYQVAPLILAMQLSKESLTSLLKITLPLALLTVVFLMPLDYLWWLVLGWIN